ncbi:hypothetical protein SS50377_21137 [Spironucleus salmonicida]|uniref:DUF4201 domain-containing protein n=1 Tax=Spironucleus salmonicida TaxID=348837 RepID=V6LSZ7_9EUKA|nr:hypothetical protein SS50377_21137 [Spironucleus salmonicida]|eukprot:EST43919.1 Hypothetical protein SS50377_16221 [Spironucleus salmonicida]
MLPSSKNVQKQLVDDLVIQISVEEALLNFSQQQLNQQQKQLESTLQEYFCIESEHIRKMDILKRLKDQIHNRKQEILIKQASSQKLLIKKHQSQQALTLNKGKLNQLTEKLERARIENTKLDKIMTKQSEILKVSQLIQVHPDAIQQFIQVWQK